MKKFLAVVPARGGSKGIKKKNIRLLYGKPLLYWTIKALLNTKVCDIVVSTDDREIYDYSKSIGALPFSRSKELGYDNVHSIHVILEVIQKINYTGTVGMFLPTSPLRTETDILESYKAFNKCDSLISVNKTTKPASSYRHMDNKIIKPIIKTTFFENQRQDSKKVFEVNGSIYLSTARQLVENKSFHSGVVKGYVMNKINSIDINSIDDFRIAEFFMKERFK